LFIYVITNLITGKIYIGQHKGANLKQYLQKKFYWARTQKTGSSYLFNAMRKHPNQGDWSIEPLMEVDAKAELDRLEKLLIALYDTRNPEVGYNICRGGEGFSGPHSEETKQLMREKMTGRTFSPESIAKMKAIPKTEVQLKNLQLCQLPENIAKRTETIRSTPRSDEQQEAGQSLLSAHHNNGLPKGYRHSPGTLKKLSASLKGREAPNRINMTGQTINGIAVLERAGSSKSGKARWTCRCYCGQTFVASGDNLRNDNTKSCGCRFVRTPS